MEERPISAYRLLSIIVGAFLAFSVASPGSATVRPCGPVRALDSSFDRQVDADRPDQNRLNIAVVYFLNIERCRRGLEPLVPDQSLRKAAARHSRNMASRRFFSHKSPISGQTTMSQRLKSVGVKFRTAGENIAQRKLYQLTGRAVLIRASVACNLTYADTRQPVPRHSYRSLAKSTVTAWMASSGHKQNILNRSFGRVGTGMGVQQGGAACGTVFLTQNFAD